MIFAHFLDIATNESNMFLVACPETRQAILIDAASFDTRIPAFLNNNNLTLKAIFITHSHYDHTGGLSEFVHRFNPVVYAGVLDINGIPTLKIGHDSKLQFGNIEGRFIALPGHTQESMGLVVPGMVFTGDAIFAGSIGGAANIHNQAIEINAIRNHVFTLPDDTLIHTGHGPSSTVSIEKKHNPFFV